MYILKHQTSHVLLNHTLAGNDRFLQYLAFGAIFNKAKAKKNIEHFLDYKQRWQNTGLDSAWECTDETEKFRFITELFRNVIYDFINYIPPGPLLMGFTAGLDSRFILHNLQQENIKPAIFTFGQIGQRDFDLSRYLSKKLGLDLILFDTSEIKWSLHWYDQVTAEFLDTPLSPRVICARYLLNQFGTHSNLHGYLNDLITGKLVKFAPLNNWTKSKQEFIQSNDTFGLQRFINKEYIQSPFTDKPLAENEQIPYIQQLNLSYRQEQRV